MEFHEAAAEVDQLVVWGPACQLLRDTAPEESFYVSARVKDPQDAKRHRVWVVDDQVAVDRPPADVAAGQSHSAETDMRRGGELPKRPREVG